MRGLVAWFFVLLIPSAHFHCVMDHGKQLRTDFQHHVQATLPFDGQAQGCENESACLCKGATLAIPVRWNVDLDHDPSAGLLKVDTGIDPLALVSLAHPLLHDARQHLDSRTARPPSGRAQRIKLQSFLL